MERSMKKIKIEKISTLKNNGQACEQDLRFALTGRIERPDNRKGETDIFDIQIKSARATLCKGTNLEDYVYSNEANRFAYVTAERVVYIMSKDEFYLFACEFATITTDSSKNGGSQKMRLRYETPTMLAWLESHASEEQAAKLFVFNEKNELISEHNLTLANTISEDEQKTLCAHYIKNGEMRGYIVFNTAKKSVGILENYTHEVSLDKDFLARLCEDNDRRAFFGERFECALVKETEKSYLIGISLYEYNGSEGIYYDWYPKKHISIKENKRASLR